MARAARALACCPALSSRLAALFHKLRAADPRILVGAAAAVVAAGVGLAFLAGGVLGLRGPGTTTTAPRALQVVVTERVVHSPGGQFGELPADVENGVVSTIAGYVRAASIDAVRPPEDGEDQAAAPPGPEDFFTPAAGARLAGTDADALTDAALPEAKAVSADRAAVTLTALATGSGVELVTATLDLRLRAVLDDDEVIVERRGDLVLVPTEAGWRIAGYHVTVTRTLASEATTTTADAAFDGVGP